MQRRVELGGSVVAERETRDCSWHRSCKIVTNSYLCGVHMFWWHDVLLVLSAG